MGRGNSYWNCIHLRRFDVDGNWGDVSQEDGSFIKRVTNRFILLLTFRIFKYYSVANTFQNPVCVRASSKTKCSYSKGHSSSRATRASISVNFERSTSGFNKAFFMNQIQQVFLKLEPFLWNRRRVSLFSDRKQLLPNLHGAWWCSLRAVFAASWFFFLCREFCRFLLNEQFWRVYVLSLCRCLVGKLLLYRCLENTRSKVCPVSYM